MYLQVNKNYREDSLCYGTIGPPAVTGVALVLDLVSTVAVERLNGFNRPLTDDCGNVNDVSVSAKNAGLPKTEVFNLI